MFINISTPFIVCCQSIVKDRTSKYDHKQTVVIQNWEMDRTQCKSRLRYLPFGYEYSNGTVQYSQLRRITVHTNINYIFAGRTYFRVILLTRELFRLICYTIFPVSAGHKSLLTTKDSLLQYITQDHYYNDFHRYNKLFRSCFSCKQDAVDWRRRGS